METSPNTANLIILSICCLHNFLIEESRPECSPANTADQNDEENGVWRKIVGDAIQRAKITKQRTGRNKNSAKIVREDLVQYVNNEGTVFWQDKMIYE